VTEKQVPLTGWLERAHLAAASIVERKPVIASAVLVLALLAGTTALIHPSYQTNDDPAMSLYGAGVAIREAPDEHLLFMHVWIGWLLKWLYTTYQDVPWYALLLYAAFAFASVAVLYTLWYRRRTPTTFALFLVLYLVLLRSYAQELQFTVVAIYCTVAGWLAASAHAMADDGAAGRGVTPGALFALLLGASVRDVGFAIASVVCVPLLLYSWRASTEAGRRSLAVIAATAAVVFALLYGINLQHYRADGAWADFYEYNALRAEFNDYRLIRYDARTQPVFEAAGWSMIDYLMIKNWFHADAKTFSKEKLRQIVEAVGGYERDVRSARVARQLSGALGNRYWMGAVVILIWIGVVWGFARVWPVIGTLAVALVLIVALTVLTNKGVPPRVFIPVAGACALVAAFLAAVRPDAAPRAPWRKLLSVAMAAGISVYAAYCVGHAVTQAHIREDQQRAFEADIAELAPHRSELYVAWAAAFPYEHIDPLASLGYLRDLKILPLGAELHTPHVAGTMERFGIHDLYLALASKPNVYLVSDEEKNRLYAQYMRERYQLDVVLRKRFQGRTFVVYEVQPI